MTILSAAAEGLQNIYTPFTPKQHLIFCILATAVYLIQYYRRGGWHNLLLILGIDLTYLTQTSICNTSETVGYLGIAEVIVLAAAFFFSHRYNKQMKAEKEGAAVSAAETAAEAEDDERRETIEKEAAEKDADIVNNAFEDE